MRWIYLSPHLDDAIYSCGGLIADQVKSGEHVENWTICAGDPPEEELSPLAEVLHAQWGTGRDAIAVRRKEDIAACRIVGVAHRHLSFQDAIYRRSPEGEWLYDPRTLMDNLHPADFQLVEEICEFISLLLRPDDLLLCPLSVGGHVDHRMIRAAAEKLATPLLYYADMPYVLNQPDEPDSLAGEAQVEISPVSREALCSWQEGIATYASQINTFWPDLETMRKVIRKYARSGVRLWRQ